ncbi:MAG: NAD-dependent epimerase/dehydratase family protein [Oscillospiraceae bacterium]|nr:NAD-dependent epimerase/dehydratase family protein [Oscillospiraceae bacterium]
MEKDALIYVAQHNDLIGASVVSELERWGYSRILTRSGDDPDLTDERAVARLFEESKPEYVFCFAGPHGGIIKNTTYPADLIYANLRIQCNIIHNSYIHGVKKLLFMTGSCVYPKECPQPITEDCFMAGKQEPTSAAYSTARAAGIEMCFAYNRQHGAKFIPAVVTNCYGPGDDYSEDGHVLASVLRKMCLAKEKEEPSLTLWGTGEPKRQFMYTGDIGAAAVLIMQKYDSTELINIAGGQEFSIAELARELKNVTGYKGEIVFDATKPDGAMRKLLDGKKLAKLGFNETVSFSEGLAKLYADCKEGMRP